MARRPTPAQLYDELLTRHGRAVADAFMAAVNDLATAADVQRMITALEAGNIEAAIQALNLDPAAYNPVLEALRTSYIEGGTEASGLLPSRNPQGAALVFRFDVRNVRAEQWLSDNAAQFVTRITDDQRLAVRQRLVAGMEAGQNPRSTALEIVGRINRATGRREGGILGMTAQQEQFSRSALQELASGDPEALRHYLTRTRRDKRFDRTVQKAIREETPVPPETLRRAIAAYERRLIQLRGEMIGRTESLRALNAAQYEALRQAVDGGAIPATAVRRVWRSASDLRVRDTHRALNGDSVGLDEAFRSPSGAVLRFPGDPQAPISETANCRCWVQPRIDWSANVR
jgi:hypothetical protein